MAIACGAAILFGLSGCGAGDEPGIGNPLLGHAIQPIIHGVPSGADSDAVVVLASFANGERANLCTATLIAPNLVITARHCVSDTDATAACAEDGTPVIGATVKGNRPAKSLVVFAGKGGIAPSTAVESAGDARGAKVLVLSSTTICNHDLALVVLDRKLPLPSAPIRFGPPKVGEKVAVVGWGLDETGKLTNERLVRADVPLVGLGPALYPNHPAWGYGSAEFMTGESICAGDSGGPSFAASGALVGIASRGGNGKPRDPDNFASTCIGDRAYAVYTHLGEQRAIVERAFEEAGEPMWLEGEADPRAVPVVEPSTEPPAVAGAPAGATPALAAAGDMPFATAMGSGCSSGGTKPSALAWVLGAALVLASRRRRARRRRSQ